MKASEKVAYLVTHPGFALETLYHGRGYAKAQLNRRTAHVFPQAIQKASKANALAIATLLKVELDEVRRYYDELASWHAFLDPIRQNFQEVGWIDMGHIKNCAELYVLCRLSKPTSLIETGISSGLSSAFMLAALGRNGSGRLYSCDLPSPYLPPHRQTGWMVPEYLRSRWEPILKSSAEAIPSILARVSGIGFFLHDSDHTYANMTKEFDLAYSGLASGGILASDDIGENVAFHSFCGRNGLSYAVMKNDWWTNRLGVAIKDA